ncbi:MAG: tripartite tricarboxylate transporter substrate binding protein [Ramlibacter sp.]|nr:tripartite tricarboxylate transporter substrate binding protein [Ramlibacter sp.]MDB5912662.1 tripartite tricarboxylate transporter substrate binding protein [Ramlibacter sp.]
MAPPSSRRRLLHAAGAAALLAATLAHAPAALAQSFPSRPVRMIVPFPPGTAPDVAARLLADKLGQSWGQAVVIENRAGAGGIPGMSAAAKAAPDGYTIAFVPAAAATLNQHLFKNPQYSMDTDFVPVATVAVTPFMLVASAKSEVRSVGDLIKAAQGSDKVTFAAAQLNSMPHLTGEMVARAAKVKFFTVPYAGSQAAVTGLLSGDAILTVDGVAGLAEHVKGGRLRALAVTSDKRLPGYEDIPTVSETIKGFEAIGWFGLFVPTGTPPAIVTAINAETNKVLVNPDLVRRYTELGMYPRPGTPAALKEFLGQQQVLLKGWVTELNLQPQ